MRIKGISIFIMFVLLGTGVVALCKLSAKHESVVEFAYWWGNVRLTENGDVVPDGMCLGNVPRVDVIVDQCIGFTRPDCFHHRTLLPPVDERVRQRVDERLRRHRRHEWRLLRRQLAFHVCLVVL